MCEAKGIDGEKKEEHTFLEILIGYNKDTCPPISLFKPLNYRQ